MEVAHLTGNLRTTSPLSNKLSEESGGWKTFMPASANLRQPNYLMLIAVDPKAEDQLFTFSESLVIGNKLQEAVIENMGGISLLPIVALANGQAQMNESLKIHRIHVLNNVEEKDFQNGAKEYLLSLPKTPLVELSLNTFSEEWKYKSVGINLTEGDKFDVKTYTASGSKENSMYRFTPIHFESIGIRVPVSHL